MRLLFLLLFPLLLSSCYKQDNLVGKWYVSTDYYQALYEIEEEDNKFYTKILMYNDGKINISKGDSSIYCMDKFVKSENNYKTKNIHFPNGKSYPIQFKLKDANTLDVKIDLKNYPYSETWNRQSYNQ